MEENTVNVCPRVLKVKNKPRNGPLFDSVTKLKAYLLEWYTEEPRPAKDCNFTFGYIAEGNKKFCINSSSTSGGAALSEKGEDYFVGWSTSTSSQEITRLNTGEEKKGVQCINFILSITAVG